MTSRNLLYMLLGISQFLPVSGHEIQPSGLKTNILHHNIPLDSVVQMPCLESCA